MHSAIKIFHLINTLSAGGAELHLLTLCKYLKRQGVEMVVAYMREHVKGSRLLCADFEKEGIRVIPVLADGHYKWRFLVNLMRLLREEKPDILHTHLPRADFAGAIGHLIYPSIALVCSVHGIYYKSWSGRWTLPLFKWIWRRADSVVAISQAVKDWLIQARFAPSEKVTVIHYGIEPKKFIRPNSELQKNWDLNKKVVVGSIGRLDPIKGHDTLINAMPEVLNRAPNSILLIAGHDPKEYGKTLQTLINNLGLHNQVKLVGFQSDVSSFLHVLDIFALASLSEGFGQVLIEAMAARKPVVASRIAPLTEIVIDGETGFLVKPGNPKGFAEAISWLLNHADKAKLMGERGQELILEKFTAERMAEATLELYRSCIQRRK